jgi:hypothetical protein
MLINLMQWLLLPLSIGVAHAAAHAAAAPAAPAAAAATAARSGGRRGIAGRDESKVSQQLGVLPPSRVDGL